MASKESNVVLLGVGVLGGLVASNILKQQRLAAPLADAVAQRLSASMKGIPLQPKHLYNYMDWWSPAGFWVWTYTQLPLQEAPTLMMKIIPRADGSVSLQMATLAAVVEVFLDDKPLITISNAGGIELR